MTPTERIASRFFVTGTDTGVGKTFVTAALARRARELGRRVLAFKPIETGCASGELGEDQRALVDAAGGWQRGAAAGMYQFARAVAPLVAAAEEGRSIDVDAIVETIRSISVDLALVEGAGGWRVPITTEEDMASLARRLGFPALVVGRAGLGTINHSLLTIEAVERDGVEVSALVLSMRPDEDPAFARSNREQIARRWRGRVLILGVDALDELV